MHRMANEYHSWDKKTITDFSEENVANMYDNGYVFVRTGKGDMNQTRSLRIDLSKYEPSSENRRVLRKAEGFGLHTEDLPLSPDEYHWMHAKLIKEFYTEKFGPGTFSANKAREILVTDKNNFNRLLNYTKTLEDDTIRCFGCCMGYENEDLLHYSYPAYDLKDAPKGMGMIMMLMAINWAKEVGKKYIYLGSATRPTDIYKLQFAGLEYFDGKSWQSDQSELKKILKDE